MVSRVHSFVLQGIDASVCEIEVDLSTAGLPRTTIVGLPDAAVKESTERVRTAIGNVGYPYPRARVTVNLAPADLRKEGPVYDLPIAVCLLHAQEVIRGAPAENGALTLDDFVIAGELALDGRVRSIKGVISLAVLARRLGRRGIIVPATSAAESSAVEGVEVYGVETLDELVTFLNGQHAIRPQAPINVEAMVAAHRPEVDFGDVRGQEAAKRALVIAAAGGHNVLMIGPPGTGKTMMARALPGILPAMSRDEALEVTRIYSSIGAVPAGRALVASRPVRSPHHTASSAAIVGGGAIPRPGEVSLAHRGVLFLDELPEFNRSVLESLREPLEDGHVTIARAQSTMRFPARFMLVAALNPTHRGHADRGEGAERDRYLARLSGPLVDRVDLHVEVPAVDFRDLASSAAVSTTAAMRSTVLAARARQAARQGPAGCNSELRGRQLDQVASLDDASQHLLAEAMRRLGLSARAYDKLRRVSRSIADVEGDERIHAHHMAEAIQYRLLDRNG